MRVCTSNRTRGRRTPVCNFISRGFYLGPAKAAIHTGEGKPVVDELGRCPAICASRGTRSPAWHHELFYRERSEEVARRDTASGAKTCNDREPAKHSLSLAQAESTRAVARAAA